MLKGIRKILFGGVPAAPKRRILLVSIQKSGTHLIENVLGLAGLERGPGSGGHTSQRSFLGLAENQFLRSSYPPENPLLGQLESGQGNDLRIILNFRDPRDVLVSWFHWLHPKSEKVDSPEHAFLKKIYAHLSDDELMDIFIRNDAFRYNEYNPLEQMRLCRALYYHPRVHNVRFEDLVGERGGGSRERQISVLRDLYAFLDINGIDCEDIARQAFNTDSATFRKGQIGTYHKELTERQLRKVNELHGDIIRQYGYSPDPM